MNETAVFGFEGPHEVFVAVSSRAMEGSVEAIDVENNEYVFFTADGTVMEATTEGNLVTLRPTAEKRPAELRERLVAYLSQPVVEIDPRLADDPPALARVLLDRQRSALWPRWPRWLHRLFYR